MFERYTDEARRVLFFGRYEASQLGSEQIEPEHVLLGLFRESSGCCAEIFQRSDVSLEAIRKELERRIVIGEKVVTALEIPFSLASKHLLEFATDEADYLHDADIGAEHLLLGILRDPRSIAGAVLNDLGMKSEAVRDEIRALRRGSPEPKDEAF